MGDFFDVESDGASGVWRHIAKFRVDHRHDFYYVSCGGVDPFALVIYAGVGVDGFYQAFSGGLDVLGFLDYELEGGAKAEITLLEEF
jgi:hypothetical protein